MLRRDTKGAILDAAQELIQTRGANAISYQHIGKIVKVRKASIHYHFPSKAKLIEAVVRRYCARFLGLVDGIVASTDSAPAKLRRYVPLFETSLQDGPGLKVCLCGMFGAELATLRSPAVAQLQRFYRENAGEWGGSWKRGAGPGSSGSRGTVRPSVWSCSPCWREPCWCPGPTGGSGSSVARGIRC